MACKRLYMLDLQTGHANRDDLFGASAGLGTCRQGKQAPHHVGRSKLLLTADFLCFGLFNTNFPCKPSCK
jgi:hypothetical protein